VVRHRGNKLRSAPLVKHVAYLKRDGITRDGAHARMFDARSDAIDERAFAERCEEDRHHFRFIISPEDAAGMTDLRAFAGDLMADAERDLGTKLDWIAVDHWNTDNPHIHVLVRGRADDGQDLVISRDYISRGFRARAQERATLELGPRSSERFSPSWRGRSRPSAGPASIVPCAASRTKVLGSPMYVLARRMGILSYADLCLAEPPSSKS
jgi:type IV secretory pathway VirD2 relaxase